MVPGSAEGKWVIKITQGITHELVMQQAVGRIFFKRFVQLTQERLSLQHIVHAAQQHNTDYV
jgi:hypothetical protein